MKNVGIIVVICFIQSFLNTISAFTIPIRQTCGNNVISISSGANPRYFGHNMMLLLSSSPSPVPEEKQVDAPEKVAPSSGTYYDDEVEPVTNVGISNSMKERLLREASQGLDPDKRNTNVILYVIGAVAILVILGGQGIFY